MPSVPASAVSLSDPRLFRQACYIDGAWVEPTARGAIEVDNPATGETLGVVPRLGREETRRAIDAAASAFPAWRRKTAKERAAVLRRWFDLTMANQEDLARLMTLEQGKPLSESKGEVAYAAGFLEWFGEEAKRVYGSNKVVVFFYFVDHLLETGQDPPAWVQVEPTEMVLKPGDAVQLHARLYDAAGRFLREENSATWPLRGIEGHGDRRQIHGGAGQGGPGRIDQGQGGKRSPGKPAPASFRRCPGTRLSNPTRSAACRRIG